MHAHWIEASRQTWVITSPVEATLAFSFVAGDLLTRAGAVFVFVFGELGEKRNADLLSFAAGIMVGASFFSLLVAGFDLATSVSGSKVAALETTLAVASGAAVALVRGLLLRGPGFAHAVLKSMTICILCISHTPG